MPIPFALRNWTIGPDTAPQELNDASPYGTGSVAMVLGGVHVDWADDPYGWVAMRLAEMAPRFGLSEAVAATVCVRMVNAFLWTAFWDPTGQAQPVEPMPPPPQ
jgi:carbamoylphosphate synthase large subunit